MLKTPVGTNPDGTVRFNYTLTQEEHDAGLVAFATGGAVGGVVSMEDGTVYDVTEGYIPVRREHVGQVHVAIHKMHHAAGRYLDQPVPRLEDVSLPER